MIDEEANRWLCPCMGFVEIAESYEINDYNKPKLMRIWDKACDRKVTMLIARVQGKQRLSSGIALRNAMRYEVVSITDAGDKTSEFEMAAINDDDKNIGASLIMTKQELANTMRLTHAFTYYSAQARTIHGPLKL